jgi:hypothetical protein
MALTITIDDIRDHKRTNPYSGLSEMLTKAEAVLYDNINEQKKTRTTKHYRKD